MGFMTMCGWLVLVSDPCNTKKRIDCGWPGVSATMCRTGACFRKADSLEPQTVVIERGTKMKVGIKIDSRDGVTRVTSLSDGAVKGHNAKLPAGSAQAIHVGDRIAKIDGYTGSTMKTALSSAKASNVTLQVLRPVEGSWASYLPMYVQTRDNIVVDALLSRAFERWSAFHFYLSSFGFILWWSSGYPAASLPVYYFLTSATVAWHLTRCCYDEQTDETGDPHCYASTSHDAQTVLMKAWQRTTKKRLVDPVLDAMKPVIKDAKSLYAKWSKSGAKK